MNKKILLVIDEIILDAFREICDSRREKYSSVVEYLMKSYLLFVGEADSEGIEFNKYLLRLIKEERGKEK